MRGVISPLHPYAFMMCIDKYSFIFTPKEDVIACAIIVAHSGIAKHSDLVEC
jgi:hypothetical protein